MQRKHLILVALILACLLAGGLALLPLTSDQTAQSASQSSNSKQTSNQKGELSQPQSSDTKVVTSIGAPDTTQSVDTKPAAEDTISKLERPLDSSAISSLALTMAEGDSRTPTIGEFEPAILPTVEQLSDPELYNEYEQSQKQRLHRAWIISADKKIQELESYIEMAESRYLDPVELAEGVQKLEAIKAMQKQLQATWQSNKSEKRAAN